MVLEAVWGHEKTLVPVSAQMLITWCLTVVKFLTFWVSWEDKVPHTMPGVQRALKSQRLSVKGLVKAFAAFDEIILLFVDDKSSGIYTAQLEIHRHRDGREAHWSMLSLPPQVKWRVHLAEDLTLMSLAFKWIIPPTTHPPWCWRRWDGNQEAQD